MSAIQTASANYCNDLFQACLENGHASSGHKDRFLRNCQQSDQQPGRSPPPSFAFGAFTLGTSGAGD